MTSTLNSAGCPFDPPPADPVQARRIRVRRVRTARHVEELMKVTVDQEDAVRDAASLCPALAIHVAE